MDDFVRIRAAEVTLKRHHFANLGEAQEQLSPADFEKLMQEIATTAAANATALVSPGRKTSRWGRRP